MNRPTPINEHLGGNDANSNGNNHNWSMYRQTHLSSNSAENNLREIRDSLVPYRTATGVGYSARNMTTSQAISASTSSGIGSYMDSSSNNSSCWSSAQQLCHMIQPPNGFTAAPTLMDGALNNVGLPTGQFTKSTAEMANMQSTKFRSGGTHHKEALIQIKQSLQPYSTTSGVSSSDYVDNMDTLSSESSSGTTASGELNGAPLRESVLLDQLVLMGFERESAWYALKLTQFRSLNHAVDVLLKLNMSHVFRDQDARSSVSRKPSFDNGESGGARSESPMPRIPTPQNRQYGIGSTAMNMPMRSTPSGVSTTGAVYSIPVNNQRIPSPMSKPLANVGMSNYGNVPASTHLNNNPTAHLAGPVTSAALNNGAEGSGYFSMTSGPKRSRITVNLQSPPRNNPRQTMASSADPLLIRERMTPIIFQADKRQVERPVAQNAVSPTVIAVNNGGSAVGQCKFIPGIEKQEGRPPSTKVLSAHFDQNPQTVRINVQPANEPSNGGQYVMKYHLEANTTSGYVVSIQGRGECPNAGASTSGAVADSIPTDLYSDSSLQNVGFRQNPSSRAPSTSATTKLSSQRILLSSPLETGGMSANELLPNQERGAKVLGPRDYTLALAQLQQQHQQQLQGYRHQILVGENGPNDGDAFDEQQALAQRMKVSMTLGNHSIQGNTAQQNRDTTENVKKSTSELSATSNVLPAVAVPPFIPLPTRLAYSKTIECFPTVKEEPSSQQLLRDSGSPTGSASTEESENGGGNSSGTATGSSIVEPLVRCESPLPDGVIQRCNRQSNDSAGVSSNSTGGNTQSNIKPCTPQAFKFYMEQHIENVIKQHHERQTRRMQLEKEMVKAKLSNQVQCQMRKLLNNKESNYLRMKRQKMNASMFEKMKTIGLGAFGEVALVRKKDTGVLFAMKTLRKSDVIQKNQAAHVKAERDILSEADNEWVVKLFYSFQDKEHLFFIMEYIPGGDMMALLIKKGIFDEDLARFYIAELVCAIQSVHKLGFIHRDIKPDNILIDRNGHIKLTDFGLCTGLRWTHDWKYYAETPKVAGHVYQDSFDLLQSHNPDANHKVLPYRQQKPRQKSHSLVGTPNYIAPEVLARSGHTQLCDWWSVGVILYEMVVGHPPFLANTPEETQAKVLNWQNTLRIPQEANLSPATTDLILRLCCGVDERLGREPNAVDIMAHPFFQNINWSTLRRSPAPYKPEILHAMDTSNFDPVEPRPDLGPTTFGTDKMSKHDHAFYEFTFRRFFDSDGHGCPTLKTKPVYQHPSLATVMERAQPNVASSSADVQDETRVDPILINVHKDFSNAAYRRAPVYWDEQAMNILRISTDQGQAPKYDGFKEGEDEPSTAYSGPGRPRMEDSFSYDDPVQAQISDGDDETSDSAVYV